MILLSLANVFYVGLIDLPKNQLLLGDHTVNYRFVTSFAK
jgi:hypothetical protein